jgi:ribosomal protein L14E/L6E/L27E
MTVLAELYDKRNSIGYEQKKMLDTVTNSPEGVFTAEQEQRYDAMDAEWQTLDDKIKEEEARQNKMAERVKVFASRATSQEKETRSPTKPEVGVEK